MPLPNFLIIGAAKSGTTSLYHYLGQHPDIFMSPIKEPKFFAHDGEQLHFHGPRDMEAIHDVVTDWEMYKTLFDGAKSEKAIGEASAEYLYSPQASERIHHYIPDAKLIVILRNPVERAYSNFLFMRRNGREMCSTFERGLACEDERIRNGWEFIWYYKHIGKYAEQLKRYYTLFPHEHVHVILFDDLQKTPQKVVQNCFHFLGVDERFESDVSAKHMATTYLPNCCIPQYKALYDLCYQSHIVRMFVPTRLRRITMEYLSRDRVVPPLTKKTRKRLLQCYLKDLQELEDLIGRDLSHWGIY
jgi:hypothetical protein